MLLSIPVLRCQVLTNGHLWRLLYVSRHTVSGRLANLLLFPREPEFDMIALGTHRIMDTIKCGSGSLLEAKLKELKEQIIKQ